MPSLKIAGMTVNAGEVKRTVLTPAWRADGTGVEVPVVAMCGTGDGPTLGIVACMHGDEYEGVAAIHRLMRQLSASHMRGNVIAVPVIAVPAFEAGTRVSPHDLQDINRVFPGKAGGTCTERIAHAFMAEIVPQCDAVLDLHGGGFRGDIAPLVLVDAARYEQVRAMTEAVGFDIIWKVKDTRGMGIGAMLDVGKPSITVEVGGDGRSYPHAVDLHYEAVLNVMRHFGILPGEVKRAPKYFHVEGGFARVGHGGFTMPVRKLHEEVEAGGVLVRVVDLFGDEVEVVRAPKAGIVCWVRTTPTVKPGDEVVIFGTAA
jgi:predicted deacylase